MNKKNGSENQSVGEQDCFYGDGKEGYIFIVIRGPR